MIKLFEKTLKQQVPMTSTTHTQNKSTSKIRKQRVKKGRPSIFATLLKWMVVFFFTGIVLLGAGVTGFYFYISKDLPHINSLNDYRPATVSTVFSDDGRKIGEFFRERRIVIPLDQMPDHLKNAFIAAEDSRFREHAGVDFAGILRAFIKNIRAGAIVQGGSTITQQVTKSFFLSPERTYERKIKEVILAHRIDRRFSKNEILFLYLNQIYLGHGAYGVEAAAENYFGKHAKDLSLAECSMLAGLPQAPSKYSPFRHYDRARQRQIYVLNRMKEDGYIDNLAVTEAISTALDIKPRKNWFIEKVPCYTEHVRRYVVKKYGENALYEQGLQIHTAVDIEYQKIARKEVLKGVVDLDRRQGFRGPVKTLSPDEIQEFSQAAANDVTMKKLTSGEICQGVVVGFEKKSRNTRVRVGNINGIISIKDIRWARKPNIKVAPGQKKITRPTQVFSPGDVIRVRAVSFDEKKDQWLFSLEQDPLAQSALLSIETGTGLVKAMIGGRDYKNSQFNRAIQSRRQPGSSFKPIIYAAALDKGYTAASVIIDSPVVFTGAKKDFTWKPHNYKDTFHGPTLFRHALVKSRNVITVKILQDIGIDYVLDYAKKLGITSPIARDLSISLGSSGASLLEIVGAYTVFANQGYRIEPVFITKILDRDGNVIEQAELKRKKVIDMSTAYIMTSILESAVTSGTGWRVKALKRPAAGKTGTTNNLHDAWFLGYTPEYVTGVWVGFDSEASLGRGETGSRTASPIWLGYMAGVLDGKPVRTFNAPEGVVFAKIDAKTGLLPNDASSETLFECFKEGTVPTKVTPSPKVFTESEDLFKSDI
ncbi:penicillin-binding protein 1A [Desulfocicer vacuolatum]|nr:PBP1A family penicillin-binding protein [Desulfocicer vacuolatum]